MKKEIDPETANEIKKELAELRAQLESQKKLKKKAAKPKVKTTEGWRDNEDSDESDFDEKDGNAFYDRDVIKVEEERLRKISDHEYITGYNLPEDSTYVDYEKSMGLEEVNTPEKFNPRKINRPFYETGIYECPRCHKIIVDETIYENYEDAKSDGTVPNDYNPSKLFSRKITNHSEAHKIDDVLFFIKSNQPTGGKIIISKFKNISLRELEKQKMIKFSDEHMGWVLYDFKPKIKNETLEFESIESSPCLSCKLEEVCSDDGEINPITCEWIKNWVKPNFIEKKESTDDDTLSFKVAKFFISGQTKFNVKGQLIEDERGESIYRIIKDEYGDRAELIFRADDVHLLDNFKNGDWITLSAVEFLRPFVSITSRGENSLFKLNCAYCKIEKL